jgi:transcriptional regulator with XRE-family HTH domain
MAVPKISQRELARRLGVSPALVARIEIGDRKPTQAVAERWAAEIGVAVEIIFPDVFRAS